MGTCRVWAQRPPCGGQGVWNERPANDTPGGVVSAGLSGEPPPFGRSLGLHAQWRPPVGDVAVSPAGCPSECRGHLEKTGS